MNFWFLSALCGNRRSKLKSARDQFPAHSGYCFPCIFAKRNQYKNVIKPKWNVLHIFMLKCSCVVKVRVKPALVSFSAVRSFTFEMEASTASLFIIFNLSLTFWSSLPRRLCAVKDCKTIKVRMEICIFMILISTCRAREDLLILVTVSSLDVN